MSAEGPRLTFVRAVLTRSGTWVHYALWGAERTVCGAKIEMEANPGEASCHRCGRWADRRNVILFDTETPK